MSRLFAVDSDSYGGIGTRTRINPTELPVMKPPGRFLPHRGGEKASERHILREGERQIQSGSHMGLYLSGCDMALAYGGFCKQFSGFVWCGVAKDRMLFVTHHTSPHTQNMVSRCSPMF